MSRRRPDDSCRKLPRNAIAACVASVFALAAPTCATAANTWYVNTCDQGVSNTDTSHGSLRWAVDPARAQSGDTIDMTAIGCSTISLQTGAIDIPQNDLKLRGPGMDALNIRAKYADGSLFGKLSYTRVFNHTGTGTLSIYDLSVSKGYQNSPSGVAKGGCIFSAGTLSLYHTSVTNCQVKTDTGQAKGGGIYASNGLFAKYSTIGGNVLAGSTVTGGTSGFAQGGGAYAKTLLSLKYSTISYNAVKSSSTNSALAGGVAVIGGSAFIGNSTISNNSSDWNIGGLEVEDEVNYAGNTLQIGNSTVSGNTAANLIGGVYADAGTAKVYNSTIAFNTAGAGTLGDYFAPGLALNAKTYKTAVTMQSSILAQNTYGGAAENDLSIASNTIAIGGGDNLIRFSQIANADLPVRTLFACPLLGPLRNNGGLVQTHALLSGSPAIDAGNTSATVYQLPTKSTGPYLFDERARASINGTLDYVRVSGPTGNPSPVADMGAYEVQQNDIVFDTNFEACSLIL